MRRLTIAITLIFAVGMMMLPTTAQDPSTTYSAISPENVSELTRIDRLGHGTVNDGAWSPDGEMLAIAGGAGVWLYDRDFELVDLLEGNANFVQWTPDSRQVAVLHGRFIQIVS